MREGRERARERNFPSKISGSRSKMRGEGAGSGGGGGGGSLLFNLINEVVGRPGAQCAVRPGCTKQWRRYILFRVNSMPETGSVCVYLAGGRRIDVRARARGELNIHYIFRRLRAVLFSFSPVQLRASSIDNRRYYRGIA